MTSVLHFPSPHSGMHLIADVAVGAAGVGYIGASLLDFIHGLEGVIAGALVVVLLFLRVRSHLRRDAAERRSGRQ